MISKEEREQLEIDSRIYICYDYLFPIASDRILATHGGNISLITIEAELLCTHDSIQVPEIHGAEKYDKDNDAYYADNIYVDNYLIIIDNGKYGLIDYNGEIMLDPVYSHLSFSTDGKICVLP